MTMHAIQDSAATERYAQLPTQRLNDRAPPEGPRRLRAEVSALLDRHA